jgi:protein gp37
MGKTKAEVADYTQNFWTGCQPVSEGCLHCYARAEMTEYGRKFDQVLRTKTWNDPLTWQKLAAKKRKVVKVFTSSWSDFFHPDADEWRPEAWSIIKRTPNLLWQVLTKRAQCIEGRLPEDWGEGYPNVCLGVTLELKKYLWRMDTLRNIPSSTRYVIAEPILEDLTPDIEQHIEGFDQVMVGGESGNKTMNFRPMMDQWARNLRDTCAAHQIAFYFKQHAGMSSQFRPTLDGVKYQQFPAAWDSYKPAYVPFGLPGQLPLFDFDLEEYS